MQPEGGGHIYSENILKFMRFDTKVHTDIVKFIQGILGFIRLIPSIEFIQGDTKIH